MSFKIILNCTMAKMSATASLFGQYYFMWCALVHVHGFVRMFIHHMCLRTRARRDTYISMCMCACAHVNRYICVQASMHTCVHVNHMCASAHTLCMHVHIAERVCVQAHMVNKHTYIYTHTCAPYKIILSKK